MTSPTLSRIVLVRDAMSQWQVEERLQGHLDIPLSMEGLQEASRIAQQLTDLVKGCLYCGRGQTSRETADAVAERLKVKVKPIDDLEGVNLGIWQGLLLSDIKAKYKRAYRAWHEDPSAMTPPSGEDIQQAARRGARAIHDVVKKLDADETAVFILPPILKAAVICRLTNRDYSDVIELYEENELVTRLPEQTAAGEVASAAAVAPRPSDSTSTRRPASDGGRVADA